MLDSKGFDLWADDYDKSVGLIEEKNEYPFAGYKRVLGSIYDEIMKKDGAKVLDIGFGTAVLTSKLYEKGVDIWGQDFSEKMIETAQLKMPNAHLFLGDINDGLHPELKSTHYDFIISTYALHHLSDKDKVKLINELQRYLKDDGLILIGDVAFVSREKLDKCKVDAGDNWDADEIYFVIDELEAEIEGLVFDRVSHCAGIITIAK